MRIITLHTGQIRVHQDQELRIHKTKAELSGVPGVTLPESRNQATTKPKTQL